MISNFKISMYPWSFLCEEAKIKQHTFSKKELCKSVRKQYRNPDSHAFFNVVFTKKGAIFETTNFGGSSFCEFLRKQNNLSLYWSHSDNLSEGILFLMFQIFLKRPPWSCAKRLQEMIKKTLLQFFFLNLKSKYISEKSRSKKV